MMRVARLSGAGREKRERIEEFKQIHFFLFHVFFSHAAFLIKIFL
jgi:hypothetical protein